MVPVDSYGTSVSRERARPDNGSAQGKLAKYNVVKVAAMYEGRSFFGLVDREDVTINPAAVAAFPRYSPKSHRALT